MDYGRLLLLTAVLSKRVGLALGNQDIYVNVVGGIKVTEPAIDLGVALAIASSFKSRPLLDRTLAVGEVSLSGELRRVPRLDMRLREAAHLGFLRAGVPRVQSDEGAGTGLEVVPLASLREAFETLLGARAEGAAAEPAEAPR